MDRREAVQYISLLLGGTLVGGNLFITGCDTKPKEGESSKKENLFSESDIAFLDEVGDTILPTTSTPGAKATQIGQFMAVMVTDCYEPANQKVFQDGIEKLNDLSKKQFDNSFVKASPQQRTDLLIQLDKEQ
ncbi:MAG: gluconate 2-dehydrogenase subunit 3 family protein, partial [Chitinophagaceae bacterium]